MHVTDDELVRRALGEQLPEVDRHAAGCARCAAELGALADTVAAARAEGDTSLPPAPPAVWDRVRDELGLADATPLTVVRRRRAPWVLAGAAALVGGVLIGAVLAGGGSPAQELTPVAAATLVAPSASGSVRLAEDGRAVVVDTDGLPDPDGYYEVWLLDPGSTRMVALGALREDGTAELPLPEGVAISDYPAVDVSVEQDDGDPAHSGVSALRAPVPS